LILKVTTKVKCPHCGRNLTVNLDLSTPEETWIDDCQLCSRPILFSSKRIEEKVAVTAEQAK